MKDTASQGETVTLTRRFTPTQAKKRAAARRAATELASASGYDAVTITAVAHRIGVSRATMYQYFASRDQLLAEIMVEWTERINADLRRNPPGGRAPAERVGEAFERILQLCARNRKPTSALLFAATSSDPAAREAFPSWSRPVDVYLKTLLGHEQVRNIEEIVPILNNVLFAALIAMTRRGQQPSEAARVLKTTAQLLLGHDS
jgi:AcrR family transcriptional regulator